MGGLGVSIFHIKNRYVTLEWHVGKVLIVIHALFAILLSGLLA